MRDYREYINLGFNNLRAYRLRSILSSLGIIIGIAAVIAVTSIGEGSKSKIQQEIKKWGIDVLRISPRALNIDRRQPFFAGPFIESSFPLSEKDIISIRKNASSVRSTASLMRSHSRLNKDNINILGVSEGFDDVATVKILKGRFVCKIDISDKHLVCVVEMSNEARIFFKGLPQIGSYLYLWNKPFKIVGLVKRDTLRSFTGDSMEVYIPISILRDKKERREEFYARAVSKNRLSEASFEIETILRSRKLGKNIYRAESQKKMLEQGNKIVDIVTLVIGGIAFLSLLVGAIGIMNIMLISVGERTREIGIRAALGAERRDIIFQFIVESVIICIIGGIIGIISGLITAWITAPILKLPFIISWKVISIGVIFSVTVGILSGLYPAFKASRLNPVEALRYE